MATFVYEAMNQAGQEVKDEVQAASSEDALSKIRNLGYFPTRIREKGGKKKAPGTAVMGKKKPKKTFTIGGVATKTITQFTRQLSTLQDAGLPILRSLHILQQQQRPGVLKNVLHDVAEDIEGGTTLSEAFAKHPKAFNRLYVNMVAAGETGGVLDVILLRLAEFMEKAQRLKRRVIGAMVYPTVVIGFAVIIVAGIMYFVIPKFKDIFVDFGVELPKMTQMLIDVSEWFIKGRPPGWAVVGLSPLMAFLFFKIVRQSKGGRYVVDVCSLKIPVFGSILEKTAIARFTRTLGTLINAGVPILEAINITRDTSGNEVFARALQKVHDDIREGDSMANPLRATKVCDGSNVERIVYGNGSCAIEVDPCFCQRLGISNRNSINRILQLNQPRQDTPLPRCPAPAHGWVGWHLRYP